MALAAAGPWAAFLALAVAVAWMVFTGRLVPRRVHEQALAAERTAKTDWYEAWKAESARNEVRDAQMGEVLAFVRRAPREAA